jgi:SAM-dependent methyltransferase
VRYIAAVPNDDGYFDERIAETYDDDAEMFDPAAVDPVVDVLVELAAGGRALELGIGTGRIALPLAQRGVPVHGVDLSKAMVARLRAKPGGEGIGVTIGDFATATVDGSFPLAYLVCNTIMNLTTQAAQVACFRNVAAHLQPGGRFVIDVMIPQLQRLPPGETFQVFSGSENCWESTSTTSRHKDSSPTTWRSLMDASTASRFRSDTCGHRSSTSWRSLAG